jgi:hemerythrin-like domain-containing protein
MTAARSTENGTDTRDMLVVHSALRREFRLAPGLVRGVATGDPSRAATVAAHLELMTWFLHHHHDIEDRILWPMLQQRVPDELAPLIALMQTQHAGIDQAVQDTRRLSSQWRYTTAQRDRDDLAQTLGRLYELLVEHLDAEEQRVLPLAAGCLKPAEWGQLGRQGMAGVERRRRPLIFGMYAYDGDPAVLAKIVARAPRLLRVIMARLGPRMYAGYARRVYGTPTP